MCLKVVRRLPSSITQAPQTAAIRTYLRGKYAAVKLFQAREAFAPKDQLDIGVNAGDLVGVVQQKDPLGNRDRWFVDNGQAQGFVQSRVLGPIGDTVAEMEAIYAPTPPPASVPTPLRHQVSTFHVGRFCAMKNDLTSRMFRPKTKFKCF